jgi:hypothetical protein
VAEKERMTLTTPEREALRATIAAYDRAIENVNACEDALAKANCLYCELQEECAEYESLAHDMMVARAEKTKLALVAGETPSFGEPPEGFAAKRIARDNVREQMDELAQTISVLAGDLEDARNEAARLSIEREEAADKVFSLTMGEKAERFEELMREARKILYQLRASCVQRVSRQSNPVARMGNMPPAVAAVAYATTRCVALPMKVTECAAEDVLGSFERKNGFTLRNEATSQVSSFWSVLKFDPNAELDAPAPMQQQAAK